MINKININHLKFKRLVELLLKESDKKFFHTLYLTSCYFSIKSASLIVEEISKIVRLQGVCIYIDRKVALGIDAEELRRFIKNYAKYGLTFYAVDTNHLFHSKAYALISFDRKNDIRRGSLVIGSSNLTGAGLTNVSGNIESMLDSQSIDLLSEFLSQIQTLKTVPIEKIYDFKSADDLNFKYALLLEGKFIHRWMDNLGQYLSVKYKLNENGKNIVRDKIFTDAGFDVEAATISKRYFVFDYEPPHLKNAKNLAKNFGLETYLGYWVPNIALEKLFEKDKFQEFREKLTEALLSQMDAVMELIAKDLIFLRSQNIIKEDENPTDALRLRIASLLHNEEKLKRIFSKYEIFSLPYDVNQKRKISELFDEMVSFVNSRASKNITQKSFLTSIDTVSIDGFRWDVKNYFYSHFENLNIWF